MLLEFRVRNYRSIRDEQVLSLVASAGDKELADSHLALTGVKSPPKVVRSAAIYGANASGKSTLLSALNYMRAVVAESLMKKPGEAYNVQPFRLDKASATQPTTFEMSFMLNGMRHQYGFALTAKKIVSESLVVYRTTQPAQWFSRKLAADGERYEYEFSAYLTGPRKLWQESTRPNALFLSTAAQLNSELLGPVFRWITEALVYLPAGALPIHDFTTAMLADEEGRRAVRDFLVSADVSIADVNADARKGVRNHLVFQPDGVVQSHREEGDLVVPVFEHAAPKGRAKFELQDESEGTQRLFALAAPLLDVLRAGRVLVIDEIDCSLHTMLVRQVLAMFHDGRTNTSAAQLIFSTHDTSLLDHKLFRRDQIWFTEKDADQATRVYPLTDFSPRKHEAWEKGYLMGRYGAVPFFSSALEVSSFDSQGTLNTWSTSTSTTTS